MTSEKEKCHLGTLYDANNDAELIAERRTCKLIRHEYNHILPTEIGKKKKVTLAVGNPCHVITEIIITIIKTEKDEKDFIKWINGCCFIYQHGSIIRENAMVQ